MSVGVDVCACGGKIMAFTWSGLKVTVKNRKS